MKLLTLILPLAYHFQEPQGITYNLGHGASTNLSDKAIEHFLKRDLEDVLRVQQGEHHRVMFVPDAFLFKDLTEKVSKMYIANYNTV